MSPEEVDDARNVCRNPLACGRKRLAFLHMRSQVTQIDCRRLTQYQRRISVISWLSAIFLYFFFKKDADFQIVRRLFHYRVYNYNSVGTQGRTCTDLSENALRWYRGTQKCSPQIVTSTGSHSNAFSSHYSPPYIPPQRDSRSSQRDK